MGVHQKTKYIFVTGGVCSSLGKGIIASSLGALLETRGLKITLTKADPYLNIDPGTMSPLQHGEVFVTDDGAETDLDIGHYERFTQAKLTKKNSFSTGQIYDAVLNKERQGDYLGRTVQVVPHITEQIKKNIFYASEGADISIVEIGGTVGDIEGLPFFEAIRQINIDLGHHRVVFIHLTLVPYLSAAQELKTKPTQHSVKELRQIGIQPDILICRSDREISEKLKEKIALFCNVSSENVINSKDFDSIYKIPLALHRQKLDEIVVKNLQIETSPPDLSNWKKIQRSIDEPIHSVNVVVVGKYITIVDSYKSIHEALIHAGIFHRAKVIIHYLDSCSLEEGDVEKKLSSAQAIIIPGGFGRRGIDGKMNAIRFARERKIPFLGICLGMHLAAVEFARNVLQIKEANSTEFDKHTKHPVVHLLKSQEKVEHLGGTMKLGAYSCILDKSTQSYSIYGKISISERHRHRYGFNFVYQKQFLDAGFLPAGFSLDLQSLEILELSHHPYFIACQFHPELKSSPIKPHPLFCQLIQKSYQRLS